MILSFLLFVASLGSGRFILLEVLMGRERKEAAKKKRGEGKNAARKIKLFNAAFFPRRVFFFSATFLSHP